MKKIYEPRKVFSRVVWPKLPQEDDPQGQKRNKPVIESWIEESQRRGEKVIVILRNTTSGEEVITSMNPAFVAEVVGGQMDNKNKP